jgi:short-subunit dehydrogenase
VKKFFVSATIAMFCFSLHAEESKVAVISGASRGVGLAIAELLVEKDFVVYGTVRGSTPKTEKNIHFITVDLADERSIQKSVQTILDKEGHIDVLINNAGYALVGPVEMLAEKEMHDQMEINFFAPIRFMQAVLPKMRERKSGHIINMSSVNAFATPPLGGMYAASKAALESVSESLCLEVQPYNIFVSVVEPGFIQTQFSLSMGTKKIPDNPYQSITDGLGTAIEERIAHPELLSPSQTPQQIAECLLSIIEDPRPKLRYQTSEHAKQLVSKKLVDLSGDMYLELIKELSEDQGIESQKE